MQCNGILWAWLRKKIMSVTLTEFHLNLSQLGWRWRSHNAFSILAWFGHKKVLLTSLHSRHKRGIANCPHWTTQFPLRTEKKKGHNQDKSNCWLLLVAKRRRGRPKREPRRVKERAVIHPGILPTRRRSSHLCRVHICGFGRTVASVSKLSFPKRTLYALLVP